MLCLFISSSIPADLLQTNFVIDITHPSFSITGLQYRSVLRTHKLALLHKSLVQRVLGEMDKKLKKEINKRLKIALGL